jgi:hypothetical protein
MAKEPILFDIDLRKPNIARVYNAFLGGKDNFAADRAVVEQTSRIDPDSVGWAPANRAFLRRAVGYLAREAGIRQFIDLGSGFPDQGNVHEIAHQADPESSIVYVDNDPVVLRHIQALTTHERGVRAVLADVRRPGEILDDPRIREVIDFGRPVGLLMLGILHYIGDEADPAGIVARFRAALTAGSYLAISSFRMPDPEDPDGQARARAVQEVFSETLGSGFWRERREILAWFGDWELVAPGLVPLPEWRPDGVTPAPEDFARSALAGGIARKRSGI